MRKRHCFIRQALYLIYKHKLDTRELNRLHKDHVKNQAFEVFVCYFLLFSPLIFISSSNISIYLAVIVQDCDIVQDLV